MRPNAHLKIFSLLVLLAASATQAFPQKGAKLLDGKTGASHANHRTAELLESPLRARARHLAASNAEEARGWDDKRAAVRILSQTADLMWEDNPTQSRAWLVRAWEIAGEVGDEDTGNKTRKYRSASPQAGARAAVLVVAQKRDRELAERFLELLGREEEVSRFNSRRGIFDDRSPHSEQLLNIALAAVNSDPAAAAGLAERSLADGISFQLQTLLLALRQRDKAAADRVFDAALNHLAQGVAHPSEGQVLASYLLTPGRVFGAGEGTATALAVGVQSPALAVTPAESDPARARRFLAVMQGILLSMPAPSTTAVPGQSAQEFVTLARSLMGGFKLYAPALWTPIEHRLTHVAQDLAPVKGEQRMPPSVREKLVSGGRAGASEKELNDLYVDGLEEAADKERDPIARKLAYAQAALATAPEDLERGRSLAVRINDAALKEQVVSLLVYRNALLALEQGRLDEAVRSAAEARPVQRAVILITASQGLLVKRPGETEEQTAGRRLRAQDYLSQAEDLLKRDDLPSSALRVRIGYVTALATLDAPRALQAFGDVVAAINKADSFDLPDASAPRVAGLDYADAQTSLPRISSGYGLEDMVRLLARADLEGTVTAADRLSKPSVRGACLLEIARTVLSAKSED